MIGHSILLDQFERELSRSHDPFAIKVHTFQVVKDGYIVIYDIHDLNGRAEYERLAFFNKKMENKSDIILR